MVARRAQEGVDASRPALAVPRLPGTAHESAPAPPARLHGSRARQHYQACRCSHAAAQLCHPSSGAKDRYPHHPGAARTQEARYDGALHPRRHQRARPGDKPARPSAEDAGLTRRRCHGRRSRWRTSFATTASHAGHVSHCQLKVMSAIERCRTGALGGHVERCEACAHLRISYNSCRNRHCPKCQAAAAKEWLVERQAELLPVPYFHVVFTLPGPIADIAYQNKTVVYDLLLKTAAETLITIAPTGQARGLKAHDPKHLGARIGLTAVLHTWGSALTHHPHAHVIVPGGGISPDGEHWTACRPNFLLSVGVLSRLFRRLVLERLTAAYQAGRLEFFADQAALAEPAAFQIFLAALRKIEWVVYVKRPFGEPDDVLAYLSRYTHRTAIANSRLVAFAGERVTFKWKDYRAKADARYKLMTLNPTG